MAIKQTGIIVSKSANFDTGDEMDFYEEGGNTGEWTMKAEKLTPNTAYYVKAYVVLDDGTVIYDVEKFATEKSE